MSRKKFNISFHIVEYDNFQSHFCFRTSDDDFGYRNKSNDSKVSHNEQKKKIEIPEINLAGLFVAVYCIFFQWDHKMNLMTSIFDSITKQSFSFWVLTAKKLMFWTTVHKNAGTVGAFFKSSMELLQFQPGSLNLIEKKVEKIIECFVWGNPTATDTYFYDGFSTLKKNIPKNGRFHFARVIKLINHNINFIS